MIDVPATRDLFYPHTRIRIDRGWSIGRDLGAEIAVRDDGCVVAIGSEGESLINSSIEQYAASLKRVDILRDHLIDDPDDEASIFRCRSELQKIDRRAFDSGAYWSLVVEEILNEQF